VNGSDHTLIRDRETFDDLTRNVHVPQRLAK
jgi:hypothetical protein